MEDEARHLNATKLTLDSLTRLTWCWGCLDVGDILTPKIRNRLFM